MAEEEIPYAQTEEAAAQTSGIGAAVMASRTTRSSLRNVKGVKHYGLDDKNALDYATQSGEVYFGPAAAIAAGQRGSRTQYSQNAVYGNVLLDSDGYLVRPFYDPNSAEEVEGQMLKFKPDQLAIIAAQMKAAGFYQTGEPSTLILNQRGWSNADITAFSYLLRYANAQGLIVQSLNLGALPPVASGGTQIKVTAEDDIKYYLDQAFLSRFGRKPNKSDVENAVKAIQENERKMAAMSRQSPSVAVAANLQAQKASPQEGAAYQLGNAIRLAFQYLGGG